MFEILNGVNCSRDIKKLDNEKLDTLCSEIRQFILTKVADTGGHLASNLGIVELTVALHRVYDSEIDRIVFDVGHQSYVHKILTGRRDRMDSLRCFGGLSGFPRPYESNSDAFVGGHASDSVSAALGMARARTLLGESYDVVAVIGDGALTGGLAYEGLCDAAQSGEPIVIILNDNKMSIDKNVGGISNALQKLRHAKAYIDFKERYRSVVSRFPRLYAFSHSVKEKIKDDVLPENFFTELGYDYLGPVNGHDLAELEYAVAYARSLRRPVVVHTVTTKGKGYVFSEETPELYHGVSSFDPNKGVINSGKQDFSAVFGSTMCMLARKDRRITAVTAAMKDGTGLNDFSSEFPERFFDVGIAEGHAVTMCAGMAKQGMLPVFAVYSSFLQRSYDMLIHDISLMGLHVVLGVDRAGLVGNDGESHQGTFDLAYLRSVPGMKIFCPASYNELREFLMRAVLIESGPCAVRYPRGTEGAYTGCRCESETILRSGSDITLVSYGVMINESLEAAEKLAAEGISAEVIKLSVINGEDFPVCAESIGKTGRFICAEDICSFGSVGSSLLELCSRRGITLKGFELCNAGNGIVLQGSVPELRKALGIDAGAIYNKALRLLGKN